MNSVNLALENYQIISGLVILHNYYSMQVQLSGQAVDIFYVIYCCSQQCYTCKVNTGCLYTISQRLFPVVIDTLKCH